MGPCAKNRTKCWLLGNDGRVYYGENLCLHPQPACPRLPGEGYEKCHSICGITGHAEDNAIKAAGAAARGGFILVDYHYVCDGCKTMCNEHDVKPMTTDEFIAAGGEYERLGDTVKFKRIPFQVSKSHQRRQFHYNDNAGRRSSSIPGKRK